MGPRSRLARMLRQVPITGTDEEIAIFHETARQNVVKQVLLHVFFLSRYRFISGTLTTGKALNQYIGGTGMNEAAHCVPCQILFGTDSLQRLITGDDDLEIELENLFADTHSIHLRFNRADKSAEDNGLTSAFGNACNRIAAIARFARFGTVEGFYHHIDEAYLIYKTEGIAAFDRAIAFQRTEMRAGRGLVDTTRAEVIFILETYRSTLRRSKSTDSLETVMGLFPKDLWQAYDALSKLP